MLGNLSNSCCSCQINTCRCYFYDQVSALCMCGVWASTNACIGWNYQLCMRYIIFHTSLNYLKGMRNNEGPSVPQSSLVSLMSNKSFGLCNSCQFICCYKYLNICILFIWYSLWYFCAATTNTYHYYQNHPTKQTIKDTYHCKPRTPRRGNNFHLIHLNSSVSF